MKSINLSSVAVLATIALISCGEGNHESHDQDGEMSQTEETVQGEAVSSNINIDASSVMWEGEMLGLYSHNGTVSFTKGNLEVSGNKVTGGSFTIDMTSIHPTDENYDPAKESTPEKLVGHLSSPDFFDVANHPTSTFNITGGNGTSVQGNLTLRGVTHEEVVENVSFDSNTNTWTGDMTVDRKKYDVSFDMPVADKVLSDDLVLKINLSL